jgi:hypothetical protein
MQKCQKCDVNVAGDAKLCANCENRRKRLQLLDQASMLLIVLPVVFQFTQPSRDGAPSVTLAGIPLGLIGLAVSAYLRQKK